MYCIHERMKALIFNLRIFESLDTSCCKAIKMWVVFIAIKRVWQLICINSQNFTKSIYMKIYALFCMDIS